MRDAIVWLVLLAQAFFFALLLGVLLAWLVGMLTLFEWAVLVHLSVITVVIATRKR